MAENFLAWELLALEHRSERLERRRRRMELRRTQNPFNLDEDEFISLFRISMDMAEELITLLQPSLRRARPYGLSVETQVLTAIRFYATGCYQRPVGQQWGHAVSQSSVSRCIHAVTEAINASLLRSWVRFPMTPEERSLARTKFTMAGQPFFGALGALDCTQIAIVGPRTHEEAYVNHHGYHSINVQAICDPDLKILNINARYPGARHDAYIWSNSPVRQTMERYFNNGERQTWLLGDEGYPLEPWLMTPLPREATGTPRFLYNEALCASRSHIERCFGVLKSTFRCLSRQRQLMYEPTMAGKIVNACAVLHNFRINNELHDQNPDAENITEHGMESQNFTQIINDGHNLTNRALAERIQTRLIAHKFSY